MWGEFEGEEGGEAQQRQLQQQLLLLLLLWKKLNCHQCPPLNH